MAAAALGVVAGSVVLAVVAAVATPDLTLQDRIPMALLGGLVAPLFDTGPKMLFALAVSLLWLLLVRVTTRLSGILARGRSTPHEPVSGP